MAQLLFLNRRIPRRISAFYINSPGGSVTAGLAIYDTMYTFTATFRRPAWAKLRAWPLCCCRRERMASVISSSARVMIHQPWGGVQGQSSDISIHAKEIGRLKRLYYRDHRPFKHEEELEEVARDVERDSSSQRKRLRRTVSWTRS